MSLHVPPVAFGNGATDRSEANSAQPSACPGCRSRSITTTARKPDENSYWRCDACGEVWNAGRRKAVSSERYIWR